MRNHVHAIVWFPETGRISRFMQAWKSQTSLRIKEVLREDRPGLAMQIGLSDPVWQRHFYDFNIFTRNKLWEKIEYMHANPVHAGLVSDPCAYAYSSARYYERNQSVGVPVRWLG